MVDDNAARGARGAAGGGRPAAAHRGRAGPVTRNCTAARAARYGSRIQAAPLDHGAAYDTATYQQNQALCLSK